MKIYILTEEDFEKLKAELSRNPKHGVTGGSSSVLNDIEQKAHDEAHGFYWYIVSRWLDKVKE